MSDTIGIDLGTGSIKIARYDDAGEPVGATARPYREPDEHEIPFGRLWDALTDGMRELAAATAGRPEVIACGLSSQVNSFALVGTDETPITPVYLWTGNWAGQEAASLEQQFGTAALASATGMMSLTGQHIAPKCLRLREAEPRQWRQARGLWQLHDLVVHRLTGEAVTEPALWSLTGLYDLGAAAWWSPMLDTLLLRSGQLPRLARAGTSAGALRPEAGEQLGLPTGIPVAVGTLDHLAGAVGVGNVQPGGASLSTGTTSCVVVTHRLRPPAMSGGAVGRHPADPGLWYALAWSGLSSTGLNWYAREVGGASSLAGLLAEADREPSYTCLWSAIPCDATCGDAGFDFVHRTAAQPAVEPGIPERPTPGQAVRAILVCLTDEIHDLIRRAGAGPVIEHGAGGVIEQLTAIGGGARSDLWLQMIADRLAMPVHRPTDLEASVRGAARLAAVAAGALRYPLDSNLRIERTFQPHD